MMIAIPYIVENAIVGLLALLQLALAAYQIFTDFVTEREHHTLLKATHALTLGAALSFVLVQFDPKALYGVFPQVAVNFLKTAVVAFLQTGAQSLLVAYLYALTKSNIGKRPTYLIRTMQISTVVYGCSLLSLMVTEVSLQKRYFEGVPLLWEACFCAYLCAFSSYATTDLRRALLSHANTKMGATTNQLKGALKKVRNVQGIMLFVCLATIVYQIYIGVEMVQLDPSLPTQLNDPSVYPATSPLANVLSLLCIGGMLYAAYSSKPSMGKATSTPSAASIERASSKATLDKASTMTLQTDKLSGLQTDKLSGVIVEPVRQGSTSTDE